MRPLRNCVAPILFVVLAMILAACSDEDQTSDGASTETQASSDSSPLVVSFDDLSGDEALISGVLLIEPSCALLDADNSRLVLIWPPERADWDERLTSIDFERLDGTSHVMTNGDRLTLAGSQVDRPTVDSAVEIASDCEFDGGWFVTDIVE